MSEGFLDRWARRKEAVRKGEEVPAEPQLKAAVATVPPPPPSPGGGGSEGGTTAPTPPPTLEDTHALTPDADFTRFAQPDVAPEVKSAAFRKLFADPHFNTMDGLDVYIDDYSKPDPIPPKMLRQLASAQFLKLFDEDERKAREVADAEPVQNVAQSGSPDTPAAPACDDHADPDLRLQQDDAPGPAGPGEGPR